MPTHLLRHACRCTRRKAESWIGDKSSADYHRYANQTKENGKPAAAYTRCESAPQANCERHEQYSRDYKVGYFNPTELAERKQARWVSHYIETFSSERENERHDDEQRSRKHSQCKERCISHARYPSKFPPRAFRPMRRAHI